MKTIQPIPSEINNMLDEINGKTSIYKLNCMGELGKTYYSKIFDLRNLDSPLVNVERNDKEMQGIKIPYFLIGELYSLSPMHVEASELMRIYKILN